MAWENSEDQRRLGILAEWREARSLFTEADQSALVLMELVTLIDEDGVPDAIWARYDTAAHCPDEENVTLLMAIAMINV